MFAQEISLAHDSGRQGGKAMEEQSIVFNGVTPVCYVVCPMGTHTVDYCLLTNIHTHTNTPPRTKPHPASGMF